MSKTTMSVLDYLLILVGVLLGVAFFTLMERKVLGYIHFRKGPTKIYFFGLLQPISDAVKLFSKNVFKGYKYSSYFFYSGPLLGLFLMFILWGIFGSYYGSLGSLYSLLFVFCFMSLGVYFLLFCGWGGNSKYSLLGGYRSISQTISYEVSLIFFILVFVWVISSYDVYEFFFFSFGYWFLFFSFVFFVGWVFVILAESNRTPFDFSEGESELVSGFNVEYGGGIFSLIFICEYGMILFLSFLSISVFMGLSFFLLKFLFWAFCFVWVRCCYPRYRYDFLMYSAWKLLLPFSLGVLFLNLAAFF